MKGLIWGVTLLAAAGVQAQEGSKLVSGLERLAAKGDADALYHLGMAYQTGSGATRDPERALSYFERAAAAGSPLGAYKLGCFHAGQHGVVEPDEAKALQYKLVAANAGYALAQTDVAAIYARRGDPALAVEWLGKAAAQGYADALFGMASLHNGKNGLRRDGGAVVGYFTLFADRAEGSADQRSWLAGQEHALTPAERTRARAIVREYAP